MYVNRVLIKALFFLFFVCIYPASAEDYVSREEMNQIKKDIKELKTLVEELRSVIGKQKEIINTLQENELEGEEHAENEHENNDEHKIEDLDDLLAAIEPKIMIAGDFVANLSDDHHIRTEEDRFALRGADIVFTGEIDGVAKATLNLAYHDDDVSLEEGYLDVYDFLPFGTDLKLGKFRVNFGLLNTIHPHDLPQVDYPAVYREHLGHEGYIDEGIGIGGEFPSLWGTPFHYTLQVMNGNRHEHGDDDDEHAHAYPEYDRLRDYDDIVYVGRLKNKFSLANNFDVSWGLSGLSGKFEDDDEAPRFYMEGADLTLLWKPWGGYKRIRWQSEGIFTQVDEGATSSYEKAYGLYSFLDYKFAPKWLVGTRYDYAKLPMHSRDNIKEYSAYFTYDYSPRNQIRLQFKNTQRDYCNERYDKDTNEVFLQWVFKLGADVHEHDGDEDHDENEH